MQSTQQISKASVCIATVLVILIASSMLLPLVVASPEDKRVAVGQTFTVTSKRGWAIIRDKDTEANRKPASLTLTCQVTEVLERGFKFKVVSGTIEIDGTSYPVTSAEGRIHVRPRFRGALVGIKGEVQGGEFNLRGLVRMREGEIFVGLRGPLKIGETPYRLGFLATASRPL